MRNLRWLGCLLFVFMAVGQVATAEKAATLQKPTGYINDYASLLSAEEQHQMEALCVEIHDKTKAQVFVVTVNSLDGVSIEEFANDLFHTWKIGEKKTDRGALLLFASTDRKYRIEVGYGLEGILNDAKVGDIGRTMVPSLKAGNYDKALGAGLDGVAQVIADDSKVELIGLGQQQAAAATESTQDPSVPETAQNSPAAFFWAFGLFMLVLIVLFLLAVVATRWAARRTAGWARSVSAGSSSSGFGASGGDSFSSGGDSGSSSSSGDSFSGGDGGDSGGGGASGSW